MSKTIFNLPVHVLQSGKIAEQTILEEVTAHLKKDPDMSWNIGGIMVRAFHIPEEEFVGKQFKDWKRGLPALYAKIGKALIQLENEHKVSSQKHGRAVWYYWSNKDK